MTIFNALNMKLFRLITLDVMGTLLDISTPVGISYSETAARYGLTICPQLLAKNFGKAWNNMKNKHPNFGLHTGLGWEKWWRLLVHETFINSTNVSIDSTTLNAVSDNLVHSYNHPNKWKCCDGALDFVKHCHDKQITLAILSNFDDRLEYLLENMGLRKYFRFVVASYTVGFEKPDERIFNLTESIAKNFDDLRNLRKHEILHIGDTPEFDYIPAKHVGWCAYLINKDPNKILKKYPDVTNECVFRDFYEIKKNI